MSVGGSPEEKGYAFVGVEDAPGVADSVVISACLYPCLKALALNLTAQVYLTKVEGVKESCFFLAPFRGGFLGSTEAFMPL